MTIYANYSVMTNAAKPFELLDIPCTASGDGSRTSYKLPVIPAYDLLNNEIIESLELAEALAREVREKKLPPLYTDHVVAKASNWTAQPVILYIDGVPTAKRDGVFGCWLYFKLSKKRHLSVVVRKSRLCKCGCRGWCTLFVVMKYLHHSIQAMALGEHPHETWDGHEFVGMRLATAGVALAFIGALIAIKRDWQEFCSTLGFSNWQSLLSPCLHCFATKENLLEDGEMDIDESPWPGFHIADYNDCCMAKCLSS